MDKIIKPSNMKKHYNFLPIVIFWLILSLQLLSCKKDQTSNYYLTIEIGSKIYYFLIPPSKAIDNSGMLEINGRDTIKHNSFFSLCSGKAPGTYINQLGAQQMTTIYNLYDFSMVIDDFSDPNYGFYRLTYTYNTPTSIPEITITESTNDYVKGIFTGSFLSNRSTYVAITGQFKVPF